MTPSMSIILFKMFIHYIIVHKKPIYLPYIIFFIFYHYHYFSCDTWCNPLWVQHLDIWVRFINLTIFRKIVLWITINGESRNFYKLSLDRKVQSCLLGISILTDNVKWVSGWCFSHQYYNWSFWLYPISHFFFMTYKSKVFSYLKEEQKY